ncbi:MAG TPA: glycerol kinase GlpK [Bdellovibrionota bacterium]|jgi:glycerol kinase|nr:glycerol kinase GlpK [Bdellovibrionota bacterium]
MKYLLAIDQGTSSSRAVIYNENFEVVGVGQEEFPQHFPQPGWVEHSLDEIWNSVSSSVRTALDVAKQKESSFSPHLIAAIGITNQRETFGLWDRTTGKPAARAIVWQCRRSQKICEALRKTAAGKELKKITGLVLDPYFSGTKLRWLLESDAKIARAAKGGELCFGTMDTYLVYKLSGGQAHVTDTSNASRTMLMDLRRREWSPAALRTLKVPKEILPQILASDALFAKTQGLKFLPDGIPVHGVLGDQQSALFGQACFARGEAKITYGTGAFMLVNSGSKPKPSKTGVSTVAWTLGKQSTYAVEASVFIAGAAVQWLRDGMQMIAKSSDIEQLAASVPSSEGVFFVPALTGLGSPYWAPSAKGLIGGLTRGSTKANLARACLEGIAHSVGDVFESLMKDASVKAKSVRVDGGASRNGLMMQYQADILRCRIERPADVETTVRGAAYVAALGVGLVKNLAELSKLAALDKSFAPEMPAREASQRKATWTKRVKASIALG